MLIVHVGGFVKSGSSAFLSALLDTDQFISLKGKTRSISESRLFSGRPAIPDFIAAHDRLSPSDVLALWTAGHRIESSTRISLAVTRFLQQTLVSHSVNAKVFRTVADLDLAESAARTADQLEKIRDGARRRAVYIQQTYLTMRTVFRDSGRHLLIDNDPGAVARSGELVASDSDVRFVAVIRSPSDHYLDRRRLINPKESRPVNFGRTAVSALRIRRSLRAVSRLGGQNNSHFFIVEFERFVEDSTYRALVFRTILPSLSPSSPITDPTFDPTLAQSRIRAPIVKRDALQQATFIRICRRAHREATEVSRAALLQPQ